MQKISEKNIIFPPVESADKNGLLAFGGDLSEERLLLAYRRGIFPWYDDPILWWCPDPRCVLFPAELKISKSMKTIFNTGVFKFTINRAFADVIKLCGAIDRKGLPGTWITEEIINAYTKLHQKNYAHSAEAWHNGELVGGLYGIRLGNVFFGESMFAKQSNASKFAFIKYVQYLQNQHVELIDCQMPTDHLQSLGARMISRSDFTQLLSKLIR